MEINNSFIQNHITSFKESFIHSLKIQHKKILLIASIIFGILLTYAIKTYFCGNKKSSHKISPLQKNDLSSVPQNSRRISLQPEIISDQWGEIILKVDGVNQTFKDVVILPSIDKKQRAVDWNWKWQTNDKGEKHGMSHAPGIRIVDLEHYVLKEKEKPDVIILSQGRGHGGQRENPGPGILQIEADVESYLKQKGFEVHILKTVAAIEKYHQISAEGKKKIAAFIHTTC